MKTKVVFLVPVYGLKSEILWAIDRVAEIWPIDTLVITSGRGGKHSYASIHYMGLAVDIRTWGLDNIHALVQAMRDVLGSDYDVIDEGTHIHIEYQPKNKFEYMK